MGQDPGVSICFSFLLLPEFRAKYRNTLHRGASCNDQGTWFCEKITSSITLSQECIVHLHALHEAGEQAEAGREWSAGLLSTLADQQEQALKSESGGEHMINEKMSGSHMDIHFLLVSLQATSLYTVNRNEETGGQCFPESEKEAHATLSLFPLLVLLCWPTQRRKD